MQLEQMFERMRRLLVLPSYTEEWQVEGAGRSI